MRVKKERVDRLVKNLIEDDVMLKRFMSKPKSTITLEKKSEAKEKKENLMKNLDPSIRGLDQ